jgi:hypothetical protein
MCFLAGETFEKTSQPLKKSQKKTSPKIKNSVEM